VCFAYLFGSQARQDAGKLSDIDIAIYLDHGIDGFTYLMCDQVVKNGVVLKDDKRQRLDFETQVLGEYHDTEVDTIKDRKNAFKITEGRNLKITYKPEDGSLTIITAMVKGE